MVPIEMKKTPATQECTGSKIADVFVDLRCFVFVAMQIAIVCIQNFVLRYSGEGLVQWCQRCLLLILINMMIQSVFFGVMRKIISIGSLFLACSYLVNCSFCILLSCGLGDADSALMLVHLPRFGVPSFIKATLYALNCISYIAIGYFIVSAFCWKCQIITEVQHFQHRRQPLLLTLGSFFSLVFGVLYFTSTIAMVVLSMGSGDYSTNVETIRMPFMSEALNLQPFFFVGLFMLMVHYKQEQKLEISRKLMLFAVLCLVLSFFSGARSRGTMQLLVLLVLWVRCIEKPDAKTVAIMLVLGVILLQLMSAIRSVRKGDLSIVSIASAFFSLENSLVYEVLNEYGTSLFVTAGFMNWVSDVHPVDFIVRQIGSILPGVSSWGGEVFLPPAVTMGFENAYHLGSTYVADIYYYFGSNGSYVAVVLGIWIAYLDKLIMRRVLDGNYMQIAILMPCILSVFNCSRASVDFGFKMLVYSAAIFLLALLFVNKGRKPTHRADGVVCCAERGENMGLK